MIPPSKKTAARRRVSYGDRCPLRSVTSSLAERAGPGNAGKKFFPVPARQNLAYPQSSSSLSSPPRACPDGRLIAGRRTVSGAPAAKRAAAPCCARAAPNAASTVGHGAAAASTRQQLKGPRLGRVATAGACTVSPGLCPVRPSLGGGDGRVVRRCHR